MESTRTQARASVARYVRAQLAKHQSDNIAIHLPRATDADIAAWRRSFLTVERQFLGYIKFTIAPTGKAGG